MLRALLISVLIIFAYFNVLGCGPSAAGDVSIPEIERFASFSESVRTEASAGNGKIVTYYVSSKDSILVSSEIQSHLERLGLTGYRKAALQSGGILFVQEVKPIPGYPMTIAVEPGEQTIVSGTVKSTNRLGATVVFTY